MDTVYRVIIALLAVALLCQAQVNASSTVGPASYVPPSCYYDEFGHSSLSVDDNLTAPDGDLDKWIVDSGCNRFVTNDINDFVPGTIHHSATNVAVGSGTTSSPCSGTVLLKGRASGITVSCQHVL